MRDVDPVFHHVGLRHGMEATGARTDVGRCRSEVCGGTWHEQRRTGASAISYPLDFVAGAQKRGLGPAQAYWDKSLQLVEAGRRK